eukprot:g1194.t1
METNNETDIFLNSVSFQPQVELVALQQSCSKPSGQRILLTEASSKNRSMNSKGGLETLYTKLCSWSERIIKEETHSGILIQESAEMRQYLEQLRNEILETKRILKTEFPLEGVHFRDNGSSKSSYSLSFSEASEFSFQSRSTISNQESFYEENELIEKMDDVKFSYSSGNDDSTVIYHDEEDENESYCSSCCFYETASSVDYNVIEEEDDEAFELNQDVTMVPEIIHFEDSNTRSELRPRLEAILSAYDLSYPLNSLTEEKDNTDECWQTIKKGAILLNNANSMNQENSAMPQKVELLDYTSLKISSNSIEDLHEKEHPLLTEKTRQNTVEQNNDFITVKTKSTFTLSSPASLSKSGQELQSPDEWTAVHCPEAFEKSELHDEQLIDRYPQQQKTLPATSKWHWFSFKLKRMWPKFPRRTKNWFQQLISKFRGSPAQSKS